MKSGTWYDNAWAGILESETPAGHAAIGTGSNPNQNGLLSFNWANVDNTSVDLFDPVAVQHGAMEAVMRAAHAPSIAGLVHQYDRKALVVALGGHKYYANDAIGGPDADIIMYYRSTPDHRLVPQCVVGHVAPRSLLTDSRLMSKTTKLPLAGEDHLATRMAIASFNLMHERVMLMNFPEFDWPLGHVDGAQSDPAAVKTLMQGFDQDLGSLEEAYRRAGVLDQTVFIITADHGFASLSHTVSATPILKAAAAAGGSIIQDSFHTAAYLWLRNGRRAVAAASGIAHLQNPLIQSVYFREPLPGGGSNYVRASGPELFRVPGMENANQYLLDTFNGPAGPNVVVFFREEVGSEPAGQASWKGDHGGAAWESQHIPLLIAGPGVARDRVSHFPARLIDIAPTALSLLGIPSSGMTGKPLADAMQRPGRDTVRGQRALAKELEPVVRSLQEESRLEVATGS
jgi:hypothetical protein